MAGTRLAVPLDRVRATGLTWCHPSGWHGTSRAEGVPDWRSGSARLSQGTFTERDTGTRPGPPRRSGTPNLALAWGLPSLARAPRNARFWLALGIWSPSSTCPRHRVDRATCTLSECSFSSQNGVVGPRFGRQLDLVVRIRRVSCRERVRQRRRWGTAWGLPLRECSCLRHHQVPKGMGMRPLIRIDRTGLYHWS